MWDNVKSAMASASTCSTRIVNAPDKLPSATAATDPKATKNTDAQRAVAPYSASRHIPQSPAGTTCQASNAIERPDAIVTSGMA